MLYPRQARRLFFLISVVWLACLRAYLSFQPETVLKGPSWIDHRLEGAGTIISNPRKGKDNLSFWLQLERVENRPEVAPLPILVQVRPQAKAGQPLPPAALGERWRVQGRLEVLPGPTYPGDFDRQADLARHGMAHGLRVSWGLDTLERLNPPTNWLLRLRLRLKAGLARVLRPREAALVTGVALGDPQELDEPMLQAFQRTGTTHLLAASGANVALIVAMALGLGGLLGYGPKPLALPCLALGLCYVGLAGFASSIVRAGWMSVFALGARALGRQADGSRCLALGVTGCLLSDPCSLFDIGFQLSAAAVLSLVVLEQPFFKLLPDIPVKKGLSSGLAVLYGLAPLFVFHFQEFNLAGLIANLLIAPPVESLLPIGLLLGLLEMTWTPLGHLLAGAVQPWAALCIAWVEWLALYVKPMALARPDVWCACAWLAGLAALIWPTCRGWALTWGMACALLSQPQPLALSRCRVVERYGKAVLWWSCPGTPDLLVVQDENQIKWATSMVRKLGCVRLDRVLNLSDRDPWIDLHDQAGWHARQSPGALEISLGRFRLVWKTFARPSLGDVDATVMIGRGEASARSPLWVRVPRKPSARLEPAGVWNLSQTPLQIETDGVDVSYGAWTSP